MSGFLLDENLPASLAPIFQVGGYRVVHVTEVGLAGRPDSELWDLAARERLIILTKDADYLDLAIAKGGVRVIQLAIGNMRAWDLLRFVNTHLDAISEFVCGDEPTLVLRRPQDCVLR